MSRAIIEIPGPTAYFEQALAAAARADAGEPLPEADYHLGFADAAHLFGELTPARLALVQSLKGLGPTSIRALAGHLAPQLQQRPSREDRRLDACSRRNANC